MIHQGEIIMISGNFLKQDSATSSWIEITDLSTTNYTIRAQIRNAKTNTVIDFSTSNTDDTKITITDAKKYSFSISSARTALLNGECIIDMALIKLKDSSGASIKEPILANCPAKFVVHDSLLGREIAKETTS
jgi:archaellum component FlaF (FlaF/FlaG flagellin family)